MLLKKTGIKKVIRFLVYKKNKKWNKNKENKLYEIYEKESKSIQMR